MSTITHALIAKFPLIQYDSSNGNLAPSKKTLWVYGSGPKSFDLTCLRWQAAFRFAGFDDIAYLEWTFDDGGVNGAATRSNAALLLL